jgi:dipeptidyl aminopeptidase/acylaminoacyl peptidase
MCAAMKKAGASCELLTIEGGGHGMSGWKEAGMEHWKGEMVDWLKQVLKVGGK